MDYAYKVTTHGRSAMAAYMAMGTKPFNITRVAFGRGKVDEGTNLADVHELIAYVSDGSISERRHENDRLYITIQYANIQHPNVKTFLLSEFMIFTENPETGQETDLIYGTLGDYRQPIPAYNPAFPPSVFNFPLTLIISDEINASVSAPSGLATHGELVSLINAMAVRKADITIPKDGWTGGGGGRYPYRLDVPVEGVTELLLPNLTVLPDWMETAISCGFSSDVQTLDGVVRVFAARVPAANISASVILYGDASTYCRVGTGEESYSLPPATATSLGAVKPGNGLKIEPDGTLSPDTASEAEVNEMLAGV